MLVLFEVKCILHNNTKLTVTVEQNNYIPFPTFHNKQTEQQVYIFNLAQTITHTYFT